MRVSRVMGVGLLLVLASLGALLAGGQAPGPGEAVLEVSVDASRVDLLAGAAGVVNVTVVNPLFQGAAGRLEAVHPPLAGWVVDPSVIFFEIPPGESRVFPFRVRAPAAEDAERALGVDFVAGPSGAGEEWGRASVVVRWVSVHVSVEPAEFTPVRGVNETLNVSLFNPGAEDALIDFYAYLGREAPPGWTLAPSMDAVRLRVPAGGFLNYSFTFTPGVDTGINVVSAYFLATSPEAQSRVAGGATANAVLREAPLPPEGSEGTGLDASAPDDDPPSAQGVPPPAGPSDGISGAFLLQALSASQAVVTGALAGLAAAAAFLLRSENRRYRALVPLLPLFTRLTRPEVLGHKVRERIYNMVLLNPGLTYGELKRQTGLHPGALVHHLRALEAHQFIVGRKEGTRRRFYPKGARLPEVPDRRLSATQEKILALLDGGSLAQHEIAQRLGITRQGANYHIKTLERQGLLRLEPRPDGWLCVPTPAGSPGSLEES